MRGRTPRAGARRPQPDRMDDGRVFEIAAGDMFEIGPGNSVVVGDEPYVSIHFLGADAYAHHVTDAAPRRMTWWPPTPCAPTATPSCSAASPGDTPPARTGCGPFPAAASARGGPARRGRTRAGGETGLVGEIVELAGVHRRAGHFVHPEDRVPTDFPRSASSYRVRIVGGELTVEVGGSSTPAPGSVTTTLPELRSSSWPRSASALPSTHRD